MGDAAEDAIAHLYDPMWGDGYDSEDDIAHTVAELGSRLRAELDRLGVRAPAQRKHRPLVVTPDIGWYKRGEECPF